MHEFFVKTSQLLIELAALALLGITVWKLIRHELRR
jgi:hypothetical protein